MDERNSNDGPVNRLFVAVRRVGVEPSGRSRQLAGLGPWEWAFLTVSIINVSLCVGLSIDRLVNVIKAQQAGIDSPSPDKIFTILLIVNSVFCLFYVIHGLLKELQFEIYMFICAAFFVLMYCIIEFIVNKGRSVGVGVSDASSDQINPVKLARLIMCCIFGPINIGLAFKVAREFGWLEFRILGASEQMQHMYHQATFFLSLLKFDLQAAVSFIILVTAEGPGLDLHEKLVLGLGLPFSLLLTFLGRASMMHEWKVGVVIFAILGLVGPTYVIYFITTTILNLTDAAYSPTRSLLYSYYVVGALTILVRGVLYIELYAVYRNFGKGLRERAFDDVANERTGLLAR